MENMRTVIFHRFLTFAAIVTCMYAGSQLFLNLYEYYDNRKQLSVVQEMYNSQPQETSSTSLHTTLNTTAARQSFSPLLEINSDIVGWITVEQTAIDYPILQADDNEYYLTRNYKKNETRAGSIFMDFRNDIHSGAEKNTILYGHRMKDGSMFAALSKYLNEEFFLNHRTIYYDTLYAGYDLEVFSVYQTTTDFYYIETEFPSDESFVDFIQKIRDKSMYEVDTTIIAGDKIVTLSTCDYSIDSSKGRMVVHAKLVERGKHI